MKKIITIFSTCFLLSGAIFTSCSTPAEKVEKAENNVVKANNELDSANKVYLEDVANFKKENDEKIAANNKSIAEFNQRIADQKATAKADYKIKIAELEKKNTDMKKKMDDYKEDGKDNWTKFKAEFSHDMDELGKAFKNLTVKNVK
jgi:hypothetical protein